jgi:hypothetical protein
LQNIKFKNLKKALTEDFFRNRDMDRVKAKFEEYYNQVKEAEIANKLKDVKVISDEEPRHDHILIFPEDRQSLEKYYELIYKRRPEMIKEKSEYFRYDFDFEVDVDNYNPWDEYRMIYRDVLRKGRAHFIIKSIPEWKFLQVGKPNVEENITESEYNYRRPNMNDSIFNILTVDRYFHERETREGRYRAKSQSIRI